uniref:ATP-dependent Clp protease proteolytic subunit n=1 Tax=Pereskia aculeata TaxID=3597 RepID=UPI0020019BB5|nr:ATP-dependent Clp protease proteolytic subunit [Pereskia aculeata]UOU85434.1 ATP-dependent Clp protease proteolytic subunit [Pereskia aculeata]WRH31696.1 clp protease proteolytic subunit [Pereskia aculeata]
MPLGVPKVPFRIPGDEEASWVELYQRLSRGRILILCQEIETEIANQIMGLMLYLSMEDNTLELYLFLNSPGGALINGMAMHNIMQFVPPDVNTICVGIAASMASYVLLGGEITKRVALPHARIMIHQPASSFMDDKTVDVYSEAEEILSMRETITRVYAQRTGKPLWVIVEDLERDAFMSATEAQAYGIVDLIGEE